MKYVHQLPWQCNEFFCKIAYAGSVELCIGRAPTSMGAPNSSESDIKDFFKG